MKTRTDSTTLHHSQRHMLINKMPAYFTSALLLGALGCTPTSSSSSASTASNTTEHLSTSTANLGTLEAALRLPERGECHTFTAYQADSNDAVFSLDVEQANVHNHRYSFLQSLPAGAYDLKGELDCLSEGGDPVKHGSLHTQFEVEPAQISQAQFRFFFDVESDLAGVDLDFCADLSLQQLSPSPIACAGEEIRGFYGVSWLRDDCGDVGLRISLGDQIHDLGPLFRHPEDQASIQTHAPQTVGHYEMRIGLTSPEGGLIPLYEGDLEVIECDETSDEPASPPADEPADESADGESADGESADGESADGESADDESADGESADDESADGESADDESADGESADDESTDDEPAESTSYEVNGVQFRMREIPGGNGVGSFLMAETEVTQELYQAVMGSNPSYFSDDDQLPVEKVSWEDAIVFCNTLSELLGLTPVYQGSDNNATMNEDANGIRLPFDAEWERAARGGQDFTYAGSDTLDDLGWYSQNSGLTTHLVGQKQANAYGIFDLSGNVWEWTNDNFFNPGSYSPGAISRSRRGGAWNNNADFCAVPYRNGNSPELRSNRLGIRFIKRVR